MRIHNLNNADLLKHPSCDDDDFIHVSLVTKDMLLDTDELILITTKTLTEIDGKLRIVSLEKARLIHELNNKYKEYFPNEIISVKMSKQEEELFVLSTNRDTISLPLPEKCRLKVRIENRSIILHPVGLDYSYKQPHLSLKNFYNEKVNVSALEIELKADKYDIDFCQYLQFQKEKSSHNEWKKIASIKQ